jgi:methionine-rich copper-binding protein CopC
MRVSSSWPALADHPRPYSTKCARIVVAVLLGLATLTPASRAVAHAFLERASPSAGSEVTSSPADLYIVFSEGVEPLFSTIELFSANGARVTTGKPHVAPNNDRRLTIDLPSLPPGTYTVVWHATSVDTHKTEGSYHFTVTH